MKKTNAARILDRMGIKYEMLEYEVDESDLSAETVAAKLYIEPDRVFKTLVARGDKTGMIVACIPAGQELNLKALAAVSGNKKVEMIKLKEVLPITGYIRGGVSPLGMKKKYPVYLNESALLQESILFSAGLRGCQLKLAPNDLARATEACICQIISAR